MRGVRTVLWFVAMAWSCAVAAACRVAGFDPLVTYVATVTASQCALAGLERLSPCCVTGAASRRERLHDLGHYVAMMVTGHVAATWVTSALAWPLHDALVAAVGAPVWPTRWPLAAQWCAALLAAELGLYAQHRWMHRSPFWWRFHAVHHEPARLDVFVATRQHALDVATATVAAIVPLVVLGAPPDVMMWLSVTSAALGLLQHANVAMVTPAWLDAWVCTPAAHRHHHSRDLREGNTNFGVFLMVFDRLFGTFEAPRAHSPRAFGLHDAPPPRSFGDELLGVLPDADARR